MDEKNKKSKKKKIIIISVILLIVVFIVVSRLTASNVEEIEFETAPVETKTLTTTISGTGKITTETSKSVTTQLVNYKVTGVNVKVGDKVKVGDVLCTFDTADLAKTVADLQASINATNTTGSITVASAERAVQDVERSRDKALDELNKTVQNLKQDFETSESGLNSARSDLQSNQEQIKNLQAQVPALTAAVNNAQNAKDVASSIYKQKESEFNTAKAASDSAQAAYNTANADPSQLAVIGTLQTQLTSALEVTKTAETALTSAATELKAKENTLAAEQAKLNEVTGKINALNNKVAGLSQTIPQQEAMVNAKREAYLTAQNSYNDQSATLNNQVANAQGQLESARVQTGVSSLTIEEQLNMYQKQLNDTNLKSTVEGTVTSVNAKAGDYYTGGALLTIEGVESFVVETEIDEYDIADIQVGMEVELKTDATREEILKGEVISIAPAATGSTASAASASSMSMMGMSSASSGSTATYTVKIALNTQNERLRLGMNAKLNIITQKSENVLAVPYDAVNEKEDGSKYICIIKDDNSEEEIKVTTGLESGYYTEVSSDKIKEGMNVKIPKVSSTTSVDELLSNMGATGGM